MAVDQRRIDLFIERSSLRTKIANVLRHAEFQIVWVHEEANSSRWALFLKLPPRLRSLFGTAREVLVWVAQYSEFQARSVTQAADTIRSERPRLCEDFALVVTLDPNTRSHVSETAETLNTVFLGFSSADFDAYKPYGTSNFIEAIQRRLYARDLYDLPSAVTRADDFFGRRGLITDIATSLRSGGRHVGLFGLRKIGKTSLLHSLRSMLQNGNDAYIGHIDIERIDAISPSPEHLLWSLGESIFDSHRQIRRIPSFELFGKYRLFSSIPDPQAVFELFDHDIRVILATTSRSIVIMLDEVELLSPNTPGSAWGGSFVRVWRLLRGLDQQCPNRLGFFVTGTNPNVFEINRIGDRENPVYNYFKIHYLRPLVHDEVSSLLTTLGSRMGLKWEPDAIRRLFSATGGHPALVRSLASLVHNSRSNWEAEARVTHQNVTDAIERFLLEKSSLLSQILAVLQEQYPDEYYLLELLTHGKIGEFREFATQFPSDTAHLVGYGLCTQPRSCTGLEIEILQTFLQKRKTSGVNDIVSSYLAPGSNIAGYEVLSSIGSPGGFSKVYAARRNDTTVALKVFNGGLLGALQREIEPLQEIEHSHVVRVVDYGKSDEGTVYMAMELLQGRSLREFCTKSTRATETQCLEWMGEILSAMTAFHPNDALVREIRQFQEISPDDLVRLEEARHGFIHRDIKPENVMITDRGAVLIDFNISIRASAQVVTRSATPGYHPPDGLGSTWDVDVDLYQLGVSMLQVAVGAPYYEGAAEDLRLAVREEAPLRFARILLKMTEPEKKNRFANASQVLAEVTKIRT